MVVNLNATLRMVVIMDKENKNIELKLQFQPDKFTELVYENPKFLAIKQFIEDWKKDPSHWTNGKRHIHGLPVLRKQANDKERFYPPLVFLFSMIEDLVNDIVPAHMNELYKTFANIKDMPM